MKKELSPKQINYLLLQLIAFTFICIIVLTDYQISIEFKSLKIGIYSFTILAIIVYEIIINLIFRKKKNEVEQPKENKEHKIGSNEKFLWFELLLLLDIIIIVAFVSQVTRLHIALGLIIGFALFYITTQIIRPYFGIKNNK
jgi:hypothetical protein